MRSILIITATILVISTNLFAQGDFISLDKQTYDYYLKGDYKNLKKTGDKMLSKGIDYYYLRLRIGILAFNNQKYAIAEKHFKKAIGFNSFDQTNREYLYYCYLYSGREADANLYLESIPYDKRTNNLKAIDKSGLSEIYLGSSVSGYNQTFYATNSLYYEAVKSSLGINAGFDVNFSNRLKGTFAYTNFRKSGTVYNSTIPSGTDIAFTQNQVYAKLTANVFPGWEFSGFGHFAFYSDGTTQVQQGRRSTLKLKGEYVAGVGISKNGWKIRTGANVSYSNFGNSSQIRGEGFLTYLPFGNLNLYLTTGGMYQTDKNWGGTYQINQEVGGKIFNFLWIEGGIVKGNSFLYSRNQGLGINNSFQIPATTLYGNLIFLVGQRFSITLTPFYSANQIYSWDLTTFNRYEKLNLNSFGGAIKLTIKNK